MAGERCEVVLYTDQHDATFASLGPAGARRVIDLWADRTAALGSRDDVAFVLVFENRGPEVGATIAHPHGQIYAYDHVPERQRRLAEAPWAPDPAPGERLVAEQLGWRAVVPYASTYPIAIDIAPTTRIPDLPTATADERDGLAAMLVDVFGRLDRLYDRPLPYMMWIAQRPTDGGDWPNAWLHFEIVSPWRSAGVARFIAAAEVACGEYFNPLPPEELAADLRRSGR